MICPWCQNKLEIDRRAEYNVERYGDAALVKADCCGNPVTVRRVVELRVNQSFTSSAEDSWGNEFGCEWLDESLNYFTYKDKVFKGKGKKIPQNADALSSDDQWYKLVGIFIMILKDNVWTPTGFKSFDELMAFKNIVWFRKDLQTN